MFPLLSCRAAVTWATPRAWAPFARMACGLAVRRGLAEYVRMSWSQPAAPLPPPIPPPLALPGVWPRCLPRCAGGLAHAIMLLSRPASAECLCAWLCSALPFYWALSVVCSPVCVLSKSLHTVAPPFAPPRETTKFRRASAPTRKLDGRLRPRPPPAVALYTQLIKCNLFLTEDHWTSCSL